MALRTGVAPNFLVRWRRLLAEGDAIAVGKHGPVNGASEVRRLGRVMGCKTI